MHGLFDKPWNWAEMALCMVVWTAMAPLLMWLLSLLPRRPALLDRARQERMVRDAMRTGSLPSDAEPGSWRVALETEVRERDGHRRVFLVSGLLAAGLVGYAAAHANGNDWRVWAVAVVLVAAGVLGARWSGRRLRTARSLLAELPAA